ncbi:MAG: serine/threonine protein kinase [Betaproteobacteria bacterium]|nr:MAG: serine/threonine protein kinase [Betaproteobacteria bacterium]
MMLAPEPGIEIDGFRLGERMHVGSMASIYRLEGPKGPLPLVMKIPRLGAGERSANVVSFEQCRMVLGALSQSPHYPTVIAYGDVETTPYLVMEYIEGTRLDTWIERAPLAPQETARLGHALALALHEVHRQDVIHLDLKATNVIYRASGEAALIDFGLSCHRHLPDLLAAEFHTPVGNWVYMAPEQIAGERCDPRSDLFALGALLYQLATGKRAFGTPSTVAQLRRRLYRDPPPPRALVAATPPWLQEVILHCLEIDAAARCASAAQAAFDLANPGQVALTERAERASRAGIVKLGRHWLKARNFAPSAPPPPATDVAPLPVIVVAIATHETDEPFFEALRSATRRRVAADGGCRIACITVVPPAAALSDDTPTGRHIKQLVSLRRWAKPLGLPEERLTYHVLESDQPAVALLDYAAVNEVEEILMGPGKEAAQVVAQAPCSVTVVRAAPLS